jgi:hypothetical protein
MTKPLLHIFIVFCSSILVCEAQKTKVSDLLKEKADTTRVIDRSILGSKPRLSLEGHIDAYYSFSTDCTALLNDRQELYSIVGPRAGQFGLNVARLAADFSSARIRGKAAIFWGDLPLAAGEPTFSMINECNVGVKLARNLWFDIGLFPTHFGTEAIFPRDNIISSIAIGSWHEPFFMGAAKLSWDVSPKLQLEGILINDYNSVVDSSERRTKALGLYARYTVNRHLELCFNNYIDNNNNIKIQDENKDRWMVYNNLHVSYGNKHISSVVGAYYGIQQNAVLASRDNRIGNAQLLFFLGLIKIHLGKKWAVSGRYEYFDNPDNFFLLPEPSHTYYQQHLTVHGPTLGLEYNPTPLTYIRIEGRYVQTAGNERIFTQGNGQRTNERISALLTVGTTFEVPNLFR